MPYTLAKGTLWFALALLVGLIIGYLLRSIVASRQLRAARAADRPDSAELDRLRGRIANLEPVVNERDRLRAEIEQYRSGRGPDDGPTPPEFAETAHTNEPPLESEPDDRSNAATDDELPTRSDTARNATAAADENEPELAPADAAEATTAADPSSDVPLDVARASEVLGRPVELDDLTVVEGIGPQIAELCRGIGIHTWADLSTIEVSLLRTMLDDAGPQYAGHEPDTWPEQAALLAAGAWERFAVLIAELDRGDQANGAE